MMRVTARGVLLGGSVGVLITTAFLWTQCKSPVPHKMADIAIQHPADDAYQILQQQKRRQPLMTNRQVGSSTVDMDDDYVDFLMDVMELEPPDEKNGKHKSSLSADETKDGSMAMMEIPCVINHESTVSCRKDDNDVYVPFSFIHNYFEIYGSLALSSDGREIFEWSHSYSHVFEPQKPYTPDGQFLNFQQFNVEARERVKCISAIDGVPISTQWESSGYTYPIQIAQYGLSHYSKFLEEPPPKRLMLEDGVKRKGQWKYDSTTSSIGRPFNREINSSVFKFLTNNKSQNSGIVLRIPESTPPNLMVLNVYLNLASNVNFTRLTITLQTQEKKPDFFYLHYICSNKLIEIQGQHIYYGLGSRHGWRYLTRNLMVDLLKGAAISSQPKKLRKRIMKTKIHLFSIELKGEGELTNLSIANNEHIRHFYDAADWLMENQDERGGWSIPVARKVIAGLLEVDPGWYSAMAQGQAISLLVRASHFSKKKKYIEAASRATQLFNVNATQGGIRTYFPGGFVWYEEYPTSPSLFVLNGFMYSLLGLYDLKEHRSTDDAARLYDQGMQSLKTLLPLFDCGQGSLYDLRHFTSHVAPNLARWDYHTTHITQLLTLATIDKGDDTTLHDTARRWKEYMMGHKARHN